MAWTDITDKTAVDSWGATLFNQVLNNIRWIANEKTISPKILLAGSNTTKTGAGSDTFSNIDGTNLTVTYSPTNTRVLVLCIGVFNVSANNAYLDWHVTGLNQRLATQYNGGTATGVAANGVQGIVNQASGMRVTFGGIFTGLTANTSYTFTPQWRQSSTANTMTWFNTVDAATLLVMEI